MNHQIDDCMAFTEMFEPLLDFNRYLNKLNPELFPDESGVRLVISDIQTLITQLRYHVLSVLYSQKSQ